MFSSMRNRQLKGVFDFFLITLTMERTFSMKFEVIEIEKEHEFCVSK